MPKSSKETLEKHEQKVIKILKRHGNISIDELAKKCGFSRQKVWRILKKLDKEKTIWGYSAIDDAPKQNLKYYILLVKRSMTPFSDSMRKEVINQQLDDYLEGITIQDIYLTHGFYDVVVILQSDSLLTTKKFVTILNQKLGEYLQEVQIMEALLPIRVRGIKNPDVKNLIDLL